MHTMMIEMSKFILSGTHQKNKWPTKWRSWLRKPFNAKWMDPNLLGVKILHILSIEWRIRPKMEFSTFNNWLILFSRPLNQVTWWPLSRWKYKLCLRGGNPKPKGIPKRQNHELGKSTPYSRRLMGVVDQKGECSNEQSTLWWCWKKNTFHK